LQLKKPFENSVLQFHTNKGSCNAATFGYTSAKTFKLKAFYQNTSPT